MVKAELLHNPYLLETDVKFNGCEPKINSLIERYRSGRLQDWIDRLPGIFHDEMNGWDFTLDFSGTKLDFECLQAAFDSAGVSRESVFLFHKNELESVTQKMEEIAALISWFENNANRRFDFDRFRESHSCFFDDTYSFIVLQGGTAAVTLDGASVERIEDAGELEKSPLENTPVLFCIHEDSYPDLQNSLPQLLKHDDVFLEQLFFKIDPALNRPHVERTLRDLGVKQPRLVDSPMDDIVKKYIEIYPRTAYVQQMITALREAKADIGAVLKEENERSAGVNSVIRHKIAELDETIQYLKDASEQFGQRDNFVIPPGLEYARENFIQKVKNWRKKKIKMTSDREAMAMAAEFEKEVGTYFAEFAADVEKAFVLAENSIRSNFTDVYSPTPTSSGGVEKRPPGL